MINEIEGYEIFDKYGVFENGDVISYKGKEPRKLKPLVNKHGYPWIDLRTKDGRGYACVNKLVALAFIPNPENKSIVNHIDGNRANSHISNLEWVLGSQDILNAYKLGRMIDHDNDPQSRGKMINEIHGYEDFEGYKIIENGDVISYKQALPVKLKHTINKAGYPWITLQCKNQRKQACIHRLIALAFIPNPENKATVNHIDGNKTNHSISNLEWATQSENILHAFRTGLKVNRKAGDSPHAKSI